MEKHTNFLVHCVYLVLIWTLLSDNHYNKWKFKKNIAKSFIGGALREKYDKTSSNAEPPNKRRHDTKHNDIQHNDIQHNDIQHDNK